MGIKDVSVKIRKEVVGVKQVKFERSRGGDGLGLTDRERHSLESANQRPEKEPTKDNPLSMLTFSPAEPSWNRDPVSSDPIPSKAGLVIDNGSYWCKAGWSGDKDPRFDFGLRNQFALSISDCESPK